MHSQLQIQKQKFSFQNYKQALTNQCEGLEWIFKNNKNFYLNRLPNRHPSGDALGIGSP